MRIGIVSDIHTNVKGLSGALYGMGSVDALFCAGDAVYGYRFSNPVIDILRQRGAYMVMGNHDYDFIKVYRERNGGNGYISAENLAFMNSVPRAIHVTLGGLRIYMTHSTPFDIFNEYIFRSSSKFKELGRVDTDVLVLGHTHEPVVERIGEVLVVNPGSCGESRDPSRAYLTYAVLDTESVEAEIRMVNL